MIFDNNQINFSNDSISERFTGFLETKNISRSTIADWFGVTTQAISSITTGKSNLTIKQVLILKEKFPDLNISWLLFGGGNMLGDTENGKDDYKEKIEKLSERIKELRDDKKRLEKMNDYLLDIIEKNLNK